jgi:hypothetical protein
MAIVQMITGQTGKDLGIFSSRVVDKETDLRSSSGYELEVF